MKLTDAQRSHLEELLRDRPQWFREKIQSDIATEEGQDDQKDSGLSAYTLACLESELGIM